MKINKLKPLNENSESKYEFGCVMAFFKFPELFKIQEDINPKDIYVGNGDKTYGLEDEPHCTLLYGFHEGVTTEDIKNIVDKYTWGPKPLKATTISIFENEDYDVLKFDMEGDILYKINDELKSLPFTSKYLEYHPHMTIGYVKKGKGKTYVEKFKNISGFQVYTSHIVYTKPDGSKDKIKIKKLYNENLSPVDVIFNLKQNEVKNSIPKPNIKILKESNKPQLLKELGEYSKQKRKLTLEYLLQEYSDPSKSYEIFSTPNLNKGVIGWSCKYKNDPRFDAHIAEISDGVYEFGFNFEGYGFNKTNSKIEGTDYLNTLHKIIKDEVIPFMQKQPSGVSLFFNVNNDDGLGKSRKKIFTYMIDKYVDPKEFDIDTDEHNFNITKK